MGGTNRSCRENRHVGQRRTLWIRGRRQVRRRGWVASRQNRREISSCGGRTMVRRFPRSRSRKSIPGTWSLDGLPPRGQNAARGAQTASDGEEGGGRSGG